MYQLKISKSQEYNSLTSMEFDKNVAKIALIITKSNLQAALKILNFNFDQKSEDESEEEESKENGTECKKMESESKDATIDVANNDNGDTKSMEDKWPLGYSDESPSSLAELKNTECQILKFIEKHSSENSQKQSEQEEPFNEFEFENESCNNLLQNKDRNQERSLQSIERNQNLTNQERSLQSIERNQNLTNQERSLQSIERNQNLTNQERSLQSIERNQNLINLHGNVQISPSRSKRINRSAIFRIPSNPPTSANQSSVQRIVSNPPTVDSTVPLPSLSNITHFTDNLPIDDLLNSNILIQNAFQYQKTKSKVQKAAITEDTCKQCVPNYIIMNQDEQDKCKIRIKNILRTYHTFQISDSDKLKYQCVIYPEGIPIRFQIYYSKIDRLEIVYYCAKKKRCFYSQLVTLFPANTGKKAEVCEINPPHRCPKHTKSSIIDGTNQNKLELESEIQNFIQVNPIVSLSQVIAFANQLVLEYNESHDDIIEISSDVIRRLYQEIKPKMKMNEDELIKKLLEHYNNQNFYITKIYSNIDDSKFYFFGLPLFINRARTLKHLFIDGTFKVVPINLSNGQLLNFLVFDNATNLYLPFLHVLMTGRSADDYNTVFNMMLTHEQIKIGLNQFSIITTDFEAALMNSIKEKISKETVLTGCIFHYIAALVKNFKKLCNQDDHASKSLLKLLCGCPFVPNSVFKLICSKILQNLPLISFAHGNINTKK